MLAIVFDGKRLLVREDMPLPVRRKGEALVRVRLAGICNTDLEVTRGYLGYVGILGHEFVGTVVDADDPDLVGRRVVGEINVACHECSMCRMGYPRHCERIRTMGMRDWPGCFADYAVLPCGNLHGVPERVGDLEAVFVEPLAAAVEVLEQVHIRQSDSVVVLGDGKLGLLVAGVLHASGYRTVLVGRHVEKLAIAQRAGIETALSGSRNLRRKADVVVECTGSPSGLADAAALVRPRGTIVLKSTFRGEAPVNLSPLVVNEVTCVGSRCGPFPPAIRLLEERKIDTSSLIGAIFCAARAVEAFEEAARRGSLKVLLDFGGEAS
ncbi:MAG: MDR/zinc-dependent alcohol dehydrogenase-like family protein [Betaproteobacteria bacterium]